MKTTKFLLAAPMLGLFLVAQSHAQVPVSNGLLAFYPLSGNVNDLSGNGQNGIPVKGLSFIPDPSFAIVASFSGSGQYASLPSSISNYCDLSVTLWIKTGSSTPNSFPWDFFLLSRDITGAAYDWNICLGQGRKIQFHTGTTTNDNLVLVSPNDISSNRWVHVACIADSANGVKTLFLNGQQVASTPWAAHPFANNYLPLYLGYCTSPTIQPYYKGNMADVRIYNRALSTSEVQQIYQFELACSPHRATATAQIENGFVVGATVTDAGCGYTTTPVVLILGGGGSGASALAQVSNGEVTGINITATGAGYTNTPTIYIYSPLGLQTGVIKAVKPSFSDLLIGTNYQLQVSGDLNNWTNQGAPFTATAPTMSYPQYWDVENWGHLFFRVQVVP